MILEISCKGTPYEIGFEHGTRAKDPISRCVRFYADQFRTVAGMEWNIVREHSKKFETVIRKQWPRYFQEITGIAHGSGFDLSDIIALNVRTELMFGAHLSDGCTSFSWLASGTSFLAQNWDWMEAQKENIVLLTIEQPDKPTIKTMTEAGIIGKIGLNSEGVGVCLNAIRVRGVDSARIPCHLGLRMALECSSREEAVRTLTKVGVASACFMLFADRGGATGLEWSSTDVQLLQMNAEMQVFHSNHYVKKHPGVDVKPWLVDSELRLQRVEQLCNDLQKPLTEENIFEILQDETNYPTAICRAQVGSSTFATLFSITMNLTEKCATVKLGRPVTPYRELLLAF